MSVNTTRDRLDMRALFHTSKAVSFSEPSQVEVRAHFFFFGCTTRVVSDRDPQRDSDPGYRFMAESGSARQDGGTMQRRQCADTVRRNGRARRSAKFGHRLTTLDEPVAVLDPALLFRTLPLLSAGQR